MEISPGASGVLGPVSGHYSLARCENARIGASGYHRPEPLHKQEDDGGAGNVCGSGEGHQSGVHNYRKLLKMRDFRVEAGFPLSLKRATMTAPKRAIGRAQFHAYMLRT
jgi:hypothetical protein